MTQKAGKIQISSEFQQMVPNRIGMLQYFLFPLLVGAESGFRPWMSGNVETSKMRLVEQAQGRLQSDESSFRFKFTKSSDEDTNVMGSTGIESSKELEVKLHTEEKLIRELTCMSANQQHSKVVEKASQAIIISQQESEKRRKLDSNLLTLHFLRGQSLHYLGQHQQAIDDVTAALDLMELTLSFKPDVKGTEGEKQLLRTLHEIQYKLFGIRGMAAESLGDVSGAIIDLRASLAIHRSLGIESDSGPILERLTILMALSKLNHPRSHYTDEERHAWNRELQLDVYAADKQRCLHCGAPPAAPAGLKLCDGCSRAWFCGRECQRAAWSSHQDACRTPRFKLTVLPQWEEASVRADIAATGYSLSTSPANGKQAVFVRDPATGLIFESLSDQDVLFVADVTNKAAIAEACAALQVARGRPHLLQFTLAMPAPASSPPTAHP